MRFITHAKFPFKYLRSLISWHTNYPTVSPQLECVDRVLICFVFHPLQEEVLNCFFLFFVRLGDKKITLPIFCRVVFLGFVAKIFGQKSGGCFFFHFFRTDRPEKERDEFMTYRILLSLELLARRLGRRSVSPEQSVLRPSVPGVCVCFLGWVLVVSGWMVKEVGWVLGWICSAFSFRVFECWEKKDTRTNLVKHCYWMLLTLGPCHFKLMIARNSFWLSSKVRGTFCWREEDLIVLPTIGYTWISLSWFFTDCTLVNQYKPPFGKICLLFLSILNKSKGTIKGTILTYPIYKWVINQLQSPLLLLTEHPSGEKDLLFGTNFWRLIEGIIKMWLILGMDQTSSKCCEWFLDAIAGVHITKAGTKAQRVSRISWLAAEAANYCRQMQKYSWSFHLLGCAKNLFTAVYSFSIGNKFNFLYGMISMKIRV